MVKSMKPAALMVAMALSATAFVPSLQSNNYNNNNARSAQHVQLESMAAPRESEHNALQDLVGMITTFAASAAIVASLTFATPAVAENELSDIYGGKGFDSSLVDQTCLVDKCSLQAKACLADDPSCRKGLTCTAKCLGDNACITGCMARYGDKNLDNLLKCTIEDNECIKIAILPGGADKFGEEPRAPAPTVQGFDHTSMEGTWFKVVGFNPNYDCYACQRNTFQVPHDKDGLIPVSNNDRLNMGVEFSMAHLLPDGSPPPPKNVRESIMVKNDAMFGSKSIGLNEYQTSEVMVFDKTNDPLAKFVANKGKGNEVSYSRTAHSEGEMFGLKFWENWYVIGENEPGQPDFKFIYYNGKTRQNNYEGAFVYSRSRALEPESMNKVYALAKEAGMNPDQFCSIRNGCFGTQEGEMKTVSESDMGLGSKSNPFRGIIASTKISELLGVEPVSARDDMRASPTSTTLQPLQKSASRPWWYEVGDYLENPHRHFEAMDSLRQPMEWPQDLVQSSKQP